MQNYSHFSNTCSLTFGRPTGSTTRVGAPDILPTHTSHRDRSYPHPEAWLNPGIHAHAAFLSLTRYASVMGVVPVLCGEILIAYNVMSWKYGCVSPFYDFQCASF